MRASTPRMVVCDMDGTLFDTIADIADAVNAVRSGLGLPPLARETVRGYVGNGARKLMERSLRGAAADIEAAAAAFESHYAGSLSAGTTLYPGVREGLARLRAGGWSLALVSNKPHGLAAALLDSFGLAGAFDFVLGDGLGAPLKPDPEPIRRALAAVGARAEDSWIVGDNHTDLEAGRRAGVRRCYATYGFGHPGEEDYDVAVDSFKAFADLVLRQSPPPPGERIPA